MKQHFFSGLLRTLSMAGGVLLVLATDVDAASWKWSTQSGRERVVIDLDAAKQAKGAARTGTTQLDIALGAAPTGLSRTGTAPTLGSLVSGLSAEGSSLRLQLRDAAFGYIVSRPNSKQVIIDVFPDPLGTRWRNPGTPAPASAPSRAASALPEAPTVGALPRPGVTSSTTPDTNDTKTVADSPAKVVTPATPTDSKASADKTTANTPLPAGKAEDSTPRTTMGKMAAASAGGKPEQVLAKGKDGSLGSGWDGLELRGQTAPKGDGQRTPRQPLQAPKLLADKAPFANGGKVTPPPPSEARLAALTSQIEKIPTSPADGPAWPELRSAVSGRTAGGVQQPRAEAGAKAGTERGTERGADTTVQPPAPPVQAVRPERPARGGKKQTPPKVETARATPGLPTTTGTITPGKGTAPVTTPVAPPAPVTPAPIAPPIVPVVPPVPDTPAAVVASGQVPEMRGQTMASSAFRSVLPMPTVPTTSTPPDKDGKDAGTKVSGKTVPLPAGKKTVATPAPVLPLPTPARGRGSVVAPPEPTPPVEARPQEGALAEYTPTGGVRGKITAALGSKPRIDLGLGAPATTPVPQTREPQSDARPMQTAQNDRVPAAQTNAKTARPTRPAPPAQTPAPPQQPDQPVSSAQKEARHTTQPTQPAQAAHTTPTPLSVPSSVPDSVPSSAPDSSLTATAQKAGTRPRATSATQETPEILAPNALRAQLNAQGPDSWPEDSALTTEGYKPPEVPVKPAEVIPSETRKPLPAKTEKAAEPAEPAPPPVIIYVDEQGNTVPKPPDSPAMIADAKKLLDSLQYQPALDLLTQIREHHLSPEQRENVLYMISEATNNLYRDNWMEGYEPIVVSTNEAMNYNLRSPKVPEALMQLGMINLLTGNQDEAAGYFGALRNKYSLDPNVPLGYLSLGKDQFKKGQYAEAVQSFQTILDEYPESRAVRDASRFMAEALFKQGHNSRALILVDFVDRRWPRLYLDDPEYLSMVGELQFQENRQDDALQTYWTYYNLIPDNPDNHKLLLRIGTMYLQKGLLKGSREVLEELLRKYPQSTSAPIALQRLGEEGLYDGNPTLDQLFALFERPSNTSPDIYYKRILKEYPTSPEAELAALRLAAWTFWSKETAEAMEQAQKFLATYPVSPYTARADDLIRRGFDREFALAREEENYERILRLWEQYPQVQAAHAEPADALRVALAKGLMNRGKEKEGMDLLSGFLDRPRDPDYGDYVYNLFLGRALRNEDWNGVLELGEKVARWDLAPATRTQLDYARAISSENIGLGDKALPLWRKLHDRDDIPLYQKAYATYFMARDAEHRRDLQAAYKLNLDTLKLFTQLEEERSDKADPERIRESLAALMDVTEVANRYAESLDWADKYAVFVPEKSPDYAGLRFRVARLHRKMGDLGRWKAILDDIIKREPESVFGRMAASELRTQEVARDLTRFTPDTK